MKVTIATKLYASFGLMAMLVVAGAAGLLHLMSEARANYARLNQDTQGAVLGAR